jgi:hypothetical protein
MMHFSDSSVACTVKGSTTSWQGILLEFETRLQTFRKIKILYHGNKKIPEMWEKLQQQISLPGFFVQMCRKSG